MELARASTSVRFMNGGSKPRFGSVQPGSGGLQFGSVPTSMKRTSSDSVLPSTVPDAISWRTSLAVMLTPAFLAAL